MLDRNIALVSRRFFGIILSDHLAEIDLTDHDVRVRLESGVLERRHEKVLVIAGAPRTWTQEVAAATVALDGSVAGEESAARILSMFGFAECDAVTLLAPLDAHHRLSGARVRRTGFLPPEHVTSTSGIPHTTRARTVIDLARVVRDARLQKIIEEELISRRLTWPDLEMTFNSMAARGRPGIARARRVIEVIEGKPPTESQLEKMYLDLLRAAGVPLPEMQITAPWAERRRGRVDAMYPDARSIIELDGRRFHERSAAFEEDRLRDQLAVLEKFRTARFTYRQIKSDPDHVVAVTRFLSQPPA